MFNPKSQIPNPKLNSRRGVTLPEVLFAILIATVGVFSVITLFPFASAQAKRARVNDMLAVAGRSAFHAFDARGMRRAFDRWLVYSPVGNTFIPAGSPPTAGGLNVAPLPIESICIDPRMIAAHTTTSGTWPASAVQTMTAQDATGLYPGGNCVQVFPYVPAGTTPYLTNNALPFNGLYMRRVTLWSGASNAIPQKLAMTLPQANAIFQIDDDTAYRRPDGPSAQYPNYTRTSPPRQDAVLVTPPTTKIPSPGTNFTAAQAASFWLKRDSEHKISWIATLVPKFDISGITSDEYTLSVVMIYDRPTDLNVLFENMNSAPQYPRKERLVNGVILGTAATGGEIYLVAPVAEMLKLKPNEWVMVSGSNLAPTGQLVTRFQWYRITDTDGEPTLNTNYNPPMYELNATLIGQDWNVQYVTPTLLVPPAITQFITANGGGLPAVRVTIVEGAFAVYEKTIRLEFGSSM